MSRQKFNMRVFGILRLASWVLALALVLAGCSSAPSAYRGSASGETLAGASRLSQRQADDVTLYAVGLVGTPYRYGGNTPGTGFDCSGLIGHVYQTTTGIAPPRTVAMLKAWGQPVLSANIRTGDLVVFLHGGEPTHAGIYVGGGRFVHAPSTGGEVRLDSLNSKYWLTQEVVFRRP
jgi:cell wall-associated NlpC family hydrolase